MPIQDVGGAKVPLFAIHLFSALLLAMIFCPTGKAASQDQTAPHWLHGELSVFAIDHSHPQYRSGRDASFVETTFKVGGTLPLGALDPRLALNLRGAIGLVRGDSRDLIFVDDETETLFDLWNLEGSGFLDGRLDFQIGRQEFEFGDGFLVWDGASDRATVWTAEMRSMPGARLVWHQGKKTLTLFTARTQKPFLVLDGFLGEHHGRSWLHGLHLALDDTAVGNWEFAAFLRNDKSVVQADTLALSIRGEHTLVSVPALTLAGELVKEYGKVHLQGGLPSASEQDRDAWGGHLDATWRFDLPLSPHIKASRILMSGDDPTTRDYEGYDPMFFGWTDWGTWYIGSISSWEVFSTNERVTLAEIGLHPSRHTRLRLQYYDIALDRAWTPGAGRNWSREINTVLDWTPRGPVVYGLAINHARPRQAARAFVGDNRSRLELIAWLIWHF